MGRLFDSELEIISCALRSLDDRSFSDLVLDCMAVLKQQNRIIACGIGKNVPICEKFVGTMLSLGMDAAFMHANTAIHGDLGLARPGYVIIMLSKSGATAEMIHLYKTLLARNVKIWLVTFTENSPLANTIKNSLVINLAHEGDMWNIVPNNSSIINLIILQKLCMALAEKMNIPLADFRRNHPGGHIGELLGKTDSLPA